MEEVIAILKQVFWGLSGLVVAFAGFKKAVEGVEWCFKKFGLETKGMREKREQGQRMTDMEASIKAIEKKSAENVQLFLEHEQAVVDKFTGIKNEIVAELGKLHDKIDKQKNEMDGINEANIQTDCAMLRDRLASGMRYFSQNVGEDGKVHISLSDYENLNELFKRYFARGGNGAFKKMYEDEFRHFVIDQ